MNTIKNNYNLLKEVYLPSGNIGTFIFENPNDYLKKIIKSFLIIISLYCSLYFIIFCINFQSMNSLNKIMKVSYAEKGYSTIRYIINSYPYNIWYLISFIFAFLIYQVCFSLILRIVFADRKSPLKMYISVCAHSFLYLIAILFPILIINSLYPIHANSGLLEYSILVALWIIFISAGIILSSAFFSKIISELFEENRYRAMLTWNLPIVTFVYLVIKNI